MTKKALAGFVTVALALSTATGQPTTRKAPTTGTGPADDGKPATPMKATVVSVSGPAQKSAVAGKDSKWLPLKKGDVLSDMTIVRTGMRSKVVLEFADRARITINSATKFGIGEVRRKGNLVKARLGLKYGTIRAKVDVTKGPNDFRIRTPVATLSVRGCTAGITHDGGKTRVNVTEDRWLMTSWGRKTNAQAGERIGSDRKLSIEHDQADGSAPMEDMGMENDEKKTLRNNCRGRGLAKLAGGTHTLPIGRRTTRGPDRTVLPPQPLPPPPSPPPPSPPPRMITAK